MIIANDSIRNNPANILYSIVNRLVLNLFIIIIPFYSFFAWICYSYIKKQIDFFTSLILLPFALYFLIYVNKKLPKYLIFYLIFTGYHLGSAFINDTIPAGANIVYFLFADTNVLACLFFIIIEYTVFTTSFINKMTILLMILVLISLVVSVIQIKTPTFFLNIDADIDSIFIEERRNFSIYSWTNLNTLAISFPIFISILLSRYESKKILLPIIVLSSIIVSFLSRTRYAMISTVIVLSQLVISGKKAITTRILYVVVLLGAVISMGLVADKFGVDVQEIVNDRILERNSDMASAKGRVTSYEVFLKVFPEHPIFGVGPKTRPDVVYLLGGDTPIIHVGYLSYLYYYGLFGCFFLLIALFFLIRDAWTVGKKTAFWGSLYGFISFCLANWTLVYFNLSEMGIVLGVIFLRYYHLKIISSVDESRLEQSEAYFIRTKAISFNDNYSLSKR